MPSSDVPAHGPRIDEISTRDTGGSLLPDATGIRVGGWEITTKKGPIAGEQACDDLRASLGGAPALPEQLYGSSGVEATHLGTGVTISFSARGALRAWMRAQGKGGDGSGEGGGEGGGQKEGEGGAATTTIARPKVPAAERWRASRAREIAEHGAPELEYDWTFTCPYGGDMELKEEKKEKSEEDGAAAAAAAAGTPGDEQKKTKLQLAWVPTSDRLDRAALSARDPLLLWDEVLLCASELDDCGYSEVGVRVRAMPGRWFAVARCFVRVDGVLVRLYESRLVATFNNEKDKIDVLRETRHSDGEFKDLVAAGAPGFGGGMAGGGGSFGGGGNQSSSQGGAYGDADAAAQALSAVAPVGVTRFVTERLIFSP